MIFPIDSVNEKSKEAETISVIKKMSINPIAPPISDRKTASNKNCERIKYRLAPIDF